MSARTARRRRRSVIVVAGEGNYDREVLRHLVPALHPGDCPEVINMKKPIRLARAQAKLSPRLEEIKRFALGVADTAKLAGVVIHVDLDGVADENYDKLRRRITEEMRATFKDCPSALALAAYEIEAWLMLFPEAFPKVRPGWRLRDADCRRDLAKLEKTKEHLVKYLGKPPYRESDAPAIMQAAVRGGHVTARPAGNNRSFQDFAEDMSLWEKTA
ncbi:hypothetical protein [Streptomyces azureus]|uniref:DUF4276 family protein n=1 Tax=Streptomyces azureus TaxID=146537 RepID=A0A0K8PK05_STRAJ|nr:hypothetical protein [Streptomyces azureus]GAP48222.1 uncharacterized protein SAZU_3049 [Streptomyces azureus]